MLRRRSLVTILSVLIACLITLVGEIPSALAAPPSVNGTIPASSATNVRIDTTVYATVNVPNGGLQEATVNENTVFLYPTSSPGTPIAAVVNSSGGGDAIVLTPTELLQKSTSYTFEVTNNVLDGSGEAIIPFTMQFTTGTEGDPPPTDISFTQTTLDTTVVPTLPYSSVAIGPDGRLWATTLIGTIYSWAISDIDGTLSDQRVYPVYPFTRGLIGLAFDPASTPTNVIIWFTSNNPDFGKGGGKHFTGSLERMVVDGTGAISSGPEVWVEGLPRSAGDHASNGLAFGPDGALYMSQGSINAMGDRDNAWRNEPEVILSAAVLRIDTAAFSGGFSIPLNVATGFPDNTNEGDLQDANNYGLGDPELDSDPNLYNPQAPGAPVTLFGTGVRNAYDLVWHSNGSLYLPTNGSAAGGNAPPTPATLPNACENRVDDIANGDYTGPSVDAATNISTRNDYLFRVEAGGYYGHPNPTRCEWVLNGGNPTAGSDPAEVVPAGNRGGYSDGTQPDRNYRGFAFDFGIGKSPNGVIEYQSNVFNGALQNRLLVVRYSANDDIIVLEPNGTNGDISNAVTNVAGFSGFRNPLDLIEDTRNGNIYVAELTNPPTGAGSIILLQPNDIGEPEIAISPDPVVVDAVTGQFSDPGFFSIRNTGTVAFDVTNVSIGGTNAADFEIVSDGASGETIQPGEVRSVSVRLNNNSEIGVKVATLIVDSTAPNSADAVAQIRGLRTRGTGGSNEPSLQWIFDAFGLQIDTGDDNDSTTPILGNGAAGNPPPLLVGDEVLAQTFEKAGPGPVTIDVLGNYAVNNNPVSINGWYEAGNANSKTEVFRIAQNNAQQLLPSLIPGSSTQFDPGSAEFGMYSIWPTFNNRVVYTEDQLNAAEGWTQNTDHHTRIFPYIDANGVTVPNTYIVTVEEFTQGWDYNDIVYVMTNVQPVVPAAQIDFENMQWEGLNDQNIEGMAWVNRYMTFHRHVNTPNSHSNVAVNDTWDLRIYNRSLTEDLVIDSITLADPGQYDLPSYPGGQLTILPGDFYDLTVQLIATNYGGKTSRFSSLTIESNDANEPTVVINLGAVVQQRPEGGQEFSLLQMAPAFFWDTDFGNPQSVGGDWIASGEEVLSRFWEVNDPTFGVFFKQLGAFHGCCGGGETGILDFTSGPNETINHSGPYGQTLFQFNNGGPTEDVVNRSGTFEFRVGNNRACDDADTCVGAGGNHGVRWWPLRDPDGNLVPHVFIVSMDYVGGQGTNFDYNDNFYILSNVRPQNAAIDISLAGSDTPDPVGVGETLTYEFTVTNNTIFAAADVNFVANLPDGVNFQQVATSDGTTCPSTDPLICNIGTLAGEGQTVITVEIQPDAIQPLSVDAFVTTSSTETNTDNNSIELITQMTVDNPASITIVKDATPDSADTFDFTGALGDFTLTDDGGPGIPQVDVAYNFQTEDAAVPAGFTIADGSPYGLQADGNTYGWLQVSNNQPIDAEAAARERNRGGIPQELDTIIHMERGDCCATGFQTEIYWQLDVPNGDYIVEVAAGDQSGSGGVYDSVHTILVEGIAVIDNFQATAGNEYAIETAVVTVSDGTLTVTPNGNNTKIAYITVVDANPSGNQQRFDNLTPGTYSITELVPAGWRVSNVVCTGATSFTPQGSSVLVTVGELQDAICTFTNADAAGNIAPTAIGDSATTTQPDAVTFDIASNDVDTDGTIDITSVDLDPSDADLDVTNTIGGEGTYTYNTTNGEVTFTPQAGFSGTSSIGYTIGDNNAARSNIALITVNVIPPTACPVLYRVNAGGGSVTDPTGDWAAQGPFNTTGGADYNTSQAIDMSGVRADLPMALFQGERSDRSPGAPQMTWTFDAGIDAGDALVVNLFFAELFPNLPDGDGRIDQNNSSISGPGDREFIITIEGNDVFTAASPYDPWGFAGDAYTADMQTFNVTVDADGELNIAFDHVTQNPQIVGLEVLEDCAPTGTPVPQNDTYIVDQGATLNVVAPGVLSNDSDPESQDLTVNTTPISAPLFGNLTLRDDGSFDYVHDNSASLVDSFTYEVEDEDGNTAQAVVTINITPGGPSNNPPVGADDPNYVMTQGSSLDVAAPGVLDNDSDPDDDDLEVETTPVSDVTKGILTLNSDGSFSYTYTGTATVVDTDSFIYRVLDGNGGSALATVTITINPPVGSTACSPFSTLPCDEIEISVPTNGVCLPLDGNVSNTLLGTGFTMVQPNSAPLADQPNPPFDANAPSFVPTLLNVNQNGTTITSTKGIQYNQPSGSPSSTETNSQVNALGVGFDASGYTEAVILSTTVSDVNFGASSGNNAQQAGIWFGLNEDQYVKLVVAKTGGSTAKAQLLVEDMTAGTTVATTLEELNSGNFPWDNDAEIDLYLTIDPVTNTVSGSYELNGNGTLVDVTEGGAGSLDIPAAYLAGVTIDNGTLGPMTFAGIFTTQRRADAAQTIDPLFSEFCITPTSTNTPPTAADDSYNATEAVELTVDAAGGVLNNDDDPDGDNSLLTARLETDVTAGSLTLNNDGSFSYTPDSGTGGTSDSFTYVAIDEATGESTPATVTIDIAAVAPVDCGPFSPNSCDTIPVVIPVGAPYCVPLDGNASGLAGTGFTMVQPHSFQLSDQPSVDPVTPSFVPSLLSPSATGLTITSTKGIQFNQQASQGNPNSTETNTLVNGLGVGFDADGYSEPIEITTTISDLDLAGSGGNNAQQAGIWFGINEDEYVKLVVSKTGGSTAKVQLFVEDMTAGTSNAAVFDELNTGNFTWSNASEIVLTMTIDPVANTVSATYDLSTDTEGELTVTEGGDSSLDIPASFIAGVSPGAGVDPLSYAGIFATQRRAAAANTITPLFSEFCITPTTSNQPPTAADDGPYNATEAVQLDVDAASGVLSNDDDPDGDNSLLTAQLDTDVSSGSLTLNSDGSFSYTPNPATGGTSDSFTYIAIDENSTPSAPATVTIDIAASAPVDCDPLSPNPCDTVPIVVPTAGVCLPLDGNGSGLAGTGFTMVQPNSAPLPNQPVGDPAAPTFVSSLLSADSSGLTITSTKGIQFYTPSESTETNSQVNALGVGFDASGYTDPIEIKTTITDLDLAGSNGNNSQQAGLWFGLNEDQYVKVVVVKQSGGNALAQLLYENLPENGTGSPPSALGDQLNTAPFAWNNSSTIDLYLTIDPDTNTITASYELNNSGTLVPIEQGGVSELTIEQEMLDGVDVDGETVSFAGIFATQRRAADAQVITPLFTEFCITPVDTNIPPTAEDDGPYSAIEGDLLTVPVGTGVLDNDNDPDGDNALMDAVIDTNVTLGSLTLNADGSFEYTPNAGTAGQQDSFTYYAVDENGAQSATPATVTIDISAAACSPLSPEPCDTVEISIPDAGVCLPFDGTGGGLADSNGIPTGFTMVDPASGPISPIVGNVDAPSYVPDYLSVANGQLTITSTKGIQYNSPVGTSGYNSLVNGLGVGFDADGIGEPFILTTTIDDPDFSNATLGGGNNSQQAGIWFGLGEDDYVKFVIYKQGNGNARLELLEETGGTPALGERLNPASPQFNNTAGNDTVITLSLVLDPTTNEATGYYAVDGGDFEEFGTILLTANKFAGELLPDSSSTVSYAGIFATTRNGGESNPFVATFEEFCITPGVVDVNDPPIVDLNGADADLDNTVTFTEQTPVGLPQGDGFISDPDGDDITELVVTLTNPSGGDDEGLTVTGAGGLTVNGNNSDVLTISGADSAADYTTVLLNIAYFNNEDNPDPTQRVITFQVSDGDLSSAQATAFVNITAVNDAPVVDLNGGGAGINFSNNFTEGNAPVAAADASVSFTEDIDGDVAQLTITLTNAVDGLEGLNVGNAAGLTVNGNDSTTVTISGTPSDANFSTALRSVTYFNNSDNPGATARTIEFVANDGSLDSATAVATVNITPVNDAPVVDLNGGASGIDYTLPANFTEGDSPVAASDATVSFTADPDSDIATLTITLVNAPDGASEGLNVGNAAGLTVNGNDTASVTISGPDDPGMFTTALRSVTYFNNSENPTETAREIQFVATDNDGSLTSATATTFVGITAVNDAPNPTGPTTATVAEDSIDEAISGVSFGDVDDGGLDMSLTINVTNGTVSLGGGATPNYTQGDGIDDSAIVANDTLANLNTILAGLTFTPTPDFAGGATIAITVNDQGQTPDPAESGTLNISVTVTQVPDAPVVDLNGSDAVGVNFGVTYTENDGAVNVTDTDADVTDIDTDPITSMTIELVSTPDGTAESIMVDTTGTSVIASINTEGTLITMNSGASNAEYTTVLQTLTYTNTSDDPTDGAGNERTITVSASDGTSTATATATVSVNSDNDAPFADDDNATTDEEAPVDINILDGDSDPDSPIDPTSIVVTGDPQFGTVDVSDTGIATYTPNPDFNGSDSFTYTISDGLLTSNEATVSITVNAVNDAPVVSVPGALQANSRNTELINTISVTDVDAGTSEVLVTVEVTAGQMTLSRTDNITMVVGNGRNEQLMSFRGTVDDVNAALVDLQYDGEGTTDAVITVTVSDEGSTGSGGALEDSATIDVDVFRTRNNNNDDDDDDDEESTDDDSGAIEEILENVFGIGGDDDTPSLAQTGNVTPAGVSIDIEVTPDEMTEGEPQEAVWTITIRNDGAEATEPLTISTQIPNQLRIDSINGAPSQINGQSMLIDIGILEPGTQMVITVNSMYMAQEVVLPDNTAAQTVNSMCMTASIPGAQDTACITMLLQLPGSLPQTGGSPVTLLSQILRWIWVPVVGFISLLVLYVLVWSLSRRHTRIGRW